MQIFVKSRAFRVLLFILAPPGCPSIRRLVTKSRKIVFEVSVQAMNMQSFATCRYLHSQVLDRMGKSGDGQERSIVEVSDEHLVVDGRRHQNKLEFAMRLQELAELQKEEIAID